MEKVEKFLFFDCEFSNTFSGFGKICEFGYVLTDTSFNIIKEKVFVINPGKTKEDRFFIGNKILNENFWYFSFDTYNKAEEFPYFYKKIKDLLEEKHTIAFAYSFTNDIQNIELTCKKYNLESLDYNIFDVQKFMRLMKLENKNPSLEKASEHLVEKSEIDKLRLHLSKDDAKLEMLVLKGLVNYLKTDIFSLLKKEKDLAVNTKEYFLKKEELIKIREEQIEINNHYRHKILEEENYIKNLKKPAKPAYIMRDLRFSVVQIDNIFNLLHSKNYYLVDTPQAAKCIVFNDKARLNKLLNNVKLEDKEIIHISSI